MKEQDVTSVERVLAFDCAEESLFGIISVPVVGPTSDTGVIVVVGGPQYRAGSHRQFVLLARALARCGFAVLRFDYRGMGDSTGDLRTFEGVSADLGCAIDSFQKAIPTLQRFVVWGLCDGASAALLYIDDSKDRRVAGLCLVNPWVRSEATLAKTQVKHYYTQRLRQPEFWRKLLSGRVALGSLAQLVRAVVIAVSGQSAKKATPTLPFQDRMGRAWLQFHGKTLLLLSGEDFTAKEFMEHLRHSPTWRGALEKPGVLQRMEPGADHTFSDRKYDSIVAQHTLDLLRQLDTTKDPKHLRMAQQGS